MCMEKEKRSLIMTIQKDLNCSLLTLKTEELRIAEMASFKNKKQEAVQ